MNATGDIVIRRCTVRVARHGGWSWGPQPRRLVDQVLAALPGLIAERLGELVPDGAPDMEITEPVRITVSLTLTDLLAGRFDPREHVNVVLEPVPSPVLETAPPQVAIPPYLARLFERPPASPARGHALTLGEFLSALAQRGELVPVLTLLPATTLEAWYQALTASATGAAGLTPGSALSPAGLAVGDSTSGPVTRVPALPPTASAAMRTSRAQYLRDAIAAIAARSGRQAASGPPRPGAEAAASRAASQPPAAAPATRVPSAGSAHARPLSAPSPGGPSPAAGPTARAAPAGAASAGPMPATAAPTGTGTADADAASASSSASGPAASSVMDIASALPFLLLGPLAQAGYLAALAPALQPVGLAAHTAAFATALAYTVLGPPERGSRRQPRRQPRDLAAAAAFAGLDAPVPGPELTEFARIADPVLPGIDAVVTRALAEGHTAGEPLILTGGRDGLLLADHEGMFPVAWADTVAGLLPAWRMCGAPPVLVGPGAAHTLTELAGADISFVAAAPPARGERWRRLPHGLWTNDHENPALARYCDGYQQAVDLAEELTRTLAGEGTGVPLADGPALGRSLLLAAGLGLGALAWTLWRQREPTDPLLALERFADLSARVSFEPDRVRVRLPLGPRHADLYAHGLLADVPGVPWFGGRVVEFSGG